METAVQLSTELIDELQSVDEILISVPLYNFSIPASLKAYIDQVMRAGFTFSYNDQGFQGLLKPKKAFVIAAKGAVYADTDLETFDFLQPYLKFILNFMGVSDVEFLSIEGTTTNEEAMIRTNANVENRISELLIR